MRSAQEETICIVRSRGKSCQPSDLAKEQGGYDQGFQGVSPGDCGPSDVHIDTRQPSDRSEGARCLNHRK
jgi:hypothetical protein